MELFIIRDGQQTGPFSQEIVQAMLKEGDLSSNDMGWHKGLPAWLPLSEVFNPGTERPTEPPPVGGSSIRARPASARQKALLKYLNAAFPETITREEAASAISDALENPKLTTRFSKWGDEKLRLHPELFQEEIDHRRANRISRYLELCQTDGAEVVKDITKAHVQVLMESLDKRQPSWDQEPRAALWDYLLPSLAEHFPQLVQEEWKGRLKFGGTSKVAAAYAGVPAGGLLPSPEPSSPSAFQAVLRGVVYGLIALGVVFAGMQVAKSGKSDVARNESKPGGAPASSQTAGTDTPVPTQTPEGAQPAHPTDAPPIKVDPNQAVAAAPAPAGAPPKNVTTPPAPAPMPLPSAEPSGTAPAMSTPATSTTVFTPAPPPPGTEPAVSKPGAPSAIPSGAGGPVTRSTATLTQTVTAQLQFGSVTLKPGTAVRLIALEGQHARVNFNNNIVLVPIVATDIDPANTIVAAPPTQPAAPVTMAPVPAAPPAVTTPTPATPSKSSPSADL